MTGVIDPTSAIAEMAAPPGRRRTRDLVTKLSMVVLAALAVLVVFGSALAPHDPAKQELSARLLDPVWAGGTTEHLLGTDGLGRDVLSRLMAGARLDLLIGFVAALIGVGVGSLLGVLAGYRGGTVEATIMRITDVQMGFPALLTILLVITVLGASPRTLIIAIGLNGWMIHARFIRAETRRLRLEPYVQAAHVAGMSGIRTVLRHVLPHLRGRMVALYLMEVPRAILSAAALSFLGVGVTSPDISWGVVIADSRSVISVAPWPSVLAGLAVMLTTASLFVFASWVEVRVDPLRRRDSRGVVLMTPVRTGDDT